MKLNPFRMTRLKCPCQQRHKNHSKAEPNLQPALMPSMATVPVLQAIDELNPLEEI